MGEAVQTDYHFGDLCVEGLFRPTPNLIDTFFYMIKGIDFVAVLIVQRPLLKEIRLRIRIVLKKSTKSFNSLEYVRTLIMVISVIYSYYRFLNIALIVIFGLVYSSLYGLVGSFVY